jgi:hypothetical protein
LAGGIYIIDYNLSKYSSYIGHDETLIIVAISKSIYGIYLFALLMGAFIGILIMKIVIKYNKDDLLLDACERIEKLEEKIKKTKT